MNINFFEGKCQSKTSEKDFGLCDKKDEQPALIATLNDKEWIAVIENKNKIEITFTAIDKCIQIYRKNGKTEKCCDGMLIYTNNIVFIELKESRKRWIKNGIEQLKTTIKRFKENHNINIFRKKQAFLSNKKHPNFQSGHIEKMELFYKELKVRLHIQNKIKI